MIYVNLPVDNCTGGGALGINLTKELTKFTDVRLISKDRFRLDDEIDYHFFKSVLASDEEIEAIRSGKIKNVNYPVFTHPNYGLPHLLNPEISVKGTKNVGYIVFEHSFLSDENVAFLKENYDIPVAACKWCEDAMKRAGIDNAVSIPHGIDPLVFNPSYSEKEFFKDKFVVFSGGKFEYRKGQDIVIRAYKVLQDKYKDVMLVCSWYNPWKFSLETMQSSKLIDFKITSDDYINMMYQTLHNNGIDVNRILLGLFHPTYMLPRIFRNTDIGLFPNRCEAGTNLVLMEYMACGKPVIASNSSGNRDVIDYGNAIKINSLGEFPISYDNKVIGNWDEPDLDETISHLEWAYNNRDKLKEIGNRAGQVMAEKFTWYNSTSQFYKLLS